MMKLKEENIQSLSKVKLLYIPTGAHARGNNIKRLTTLSR
jgi:hypothetical protein